MSQKLVYGTTMLQIHINPKYERWNFRITVGNWMSPQLGYGTTILKMA